MRHTIVVGVLLLSSAVIAGPTVQINPVDKTLSGQPCRDAYHAWSYTPETRQDETDQLSAYTIGVRAKQLYNCASTDEEGSEIQWRQGSPGYLGLAGYYAASLGDRYKHFIVRHDLSSQFVYEDKIGQR